MSDSPPAIVGQRLTRAAFSQLSGRLAGYPFVKLVVDRPGETIHFLNNHVVQMHGHYIAAEILGITAEELEGNIDHYNHGFYLDPKRDLYLGILSLHEGDRPFFALETVEIDTLDPDMVRFFYKAVRDNVDPSIPILWKPANHLQEGYVGLIDAGEVPRVLAHELFATSNFIPLNAGRTQGRLRAFADEAAYRAARGSIEWYDIVAMGRVPDDIPRLSGVINSDHTTPLSHTNVLATGWQIPNCIQLGALERIRQEGLDGRWVEYSVAADAEEVGLKPIERPAEADIRPAWRTLRVEMEAPSTDRTPIVPLTKLRAVDRYRYGTKAANLGELCRVLASGSDRLTGFYRVRRPPRANLLPQLAHLLDASPEDDLEAAAWEYVSSTLQVPVGIAIPFAFQRQFLESSPQIQQTIGKLKMALELEARQVDSLCVRVQQLIRGTRIPEKIRNYIDSQVAATVAGVSSFVVRSSSNAEDLEGFSAAGIYDSINHVAKADQLFESIKQVWASLLSPRSVRLRQEVGISLEDSYMGVIVQEEIPAELGGVLVTANPLKRDDFRNVFLNLTGGSVEKVVEGEVQPYQYLYNVIEGGGRTVSIGEAVADLPPEKKALLQRVALSGRLLQAHFSPDYTFASPIDVEWLSDGERVHILQLRPYSG